MDAAHQGVAALAAGAVVEVVAGAVLVAVVAVSGPPRCVAVDA